MSPEFLRKSQQSVVNGYTNNIERHRLRSIHVYNLYKKSSFSHASLSLSHKDNTVVRSAPFHKTLCSKCLTKDAIQFCSQCQHKFYCGPKCQLDDWINGHKNYCLFSTHPSIHHSIDYR